MRVGIETTNVKRRGERLALYHTAINSENQVLTSRINPLFIETLPIPTFT